LAGSPAAIDDVLSGKVMRRFPLLVTGGLSETKKRRSEIASAGGELPDSKNLATSMSFANACGAFIRAGRR
jgi:hypothetical protein